MVDGVGAELVLEPLVAAFANELVIDDIRLVVVAVPVPLVVPVVLVDEDEDVTVPVRVVPEEPVEGIEVVEPLILSISVVVPPATALGASAPVARRAP